MWNTSNGQCPPRFLRHHAIGVVNLARLTGCTTLLPTSLLVCCTLPESELLSGIECQDGLREQLSPADAQLCSNAKSKLTIARVAIGLRVFNPRASRNCSYSYGTTGNYDPDRERLFDVLDRFADTLKDPQHEAEAAALCRPDPSASFVPLFEELLSSSNKTSLCRDCAKMINMRDVDERRKVWKDIPALLGITVEGWGRLQ